MEKLVDKLNEKAISLIEQYILKKTTNFKMRELWKKVVGKACKITEEIDDSVADYIVNLPAVQRHFLWLTSNKPLDDIYYSFIITIAVELCSINVENRVAISFAEAILDNWFELNRLDSLKLRSKIIDNEIIEIINDREILYCKYFMLYNDPFSVDTIRVYYPKNGESFISWDKKYSIDIKTNLSKGTEYGFCRIGFSYSRIKEQDNEKFLKIAYVNDDREIFRFESGDIHGIDEKRILWVM